MKKILYNSRRKNSRSRIIHVTARRKVSIFQNYIFIIVNFGIDFFYFVKVIDSFCVFTHGSHYGNHVYFILFT
ncbi:hypothetical protein [Flavobacterium magnesitis]|uniref:hypothetical protein n=1 Tax=Flavobacterium magnesitis TaxID=3138077 RepID=UPI00358E2B3E